MEKGIKKNKKMTIDDLAGMMVKRFDGVEKDIAQVSTDLKSFKTETRERFDKVDDRLDEIDENIGGIIKDYHPRIIALEEKVFGSSTLAES